MISPFYGINPAQEENPYFFLYLFQDLNDVIMSCKFTGIFFWKDEHLGAKEASKRRPEGQKRVPHAAPVPGRVGPPLFVLVAPFTPILLPEASSWPKNFYIKSPPRSFVSRRGETENQKQRDRRMPPEKIGGGKRRRNPPPSIVFIINFYSKIISYLHCKLLANMMYDAIYFSLDLLCLSIYVWEVIYLWH